MPAFAGMTMGHHPINPVMPAKAGISLLFRQLRQMLRGKIQCETYEMGKL